MHSSCLGPDLASKESTGIHAACCFSGSRGVFVNSYYCISVWICTCIWGTVRAGNLFSPPFLKKILDRVVGISLIAMVPIHQRIWIMAMMEVYRVSPLMPCQMTHRKHYLRLLHQANLYSSFNHFPVSRLALKVDHAVLSWSDY